MREPPACTPVSCAVMGKRTHSRDIRFSSLRSRMTGFAAMLMAVPVAAPVAASTPVQPSGSPAPRVRSTIAIRTPPSGAWPDAVETIAFELDQAGYHVVPDGVEAGATITVSHDAGGWKVVLLDAAQNIVLRAAGHQGESPQLIGLHAVELVHASRLDVPRHRRQQPTATPRRSAALEPAEPSPAEPKVWVFDVGVGVSSIGLLGPRLGFARHWKRAELGTALEAGFGNAGNVAFPPRRDDWWLGTPRVVVRSTVQLAYVLRVGHRLRPLVGLTSELVAPVVASTHQNQDPEFELDTVEVGLLWVPGLDVGTRFVLGPKVALRASVRAGPIVTLHPIDLASGGTLRLPHGVATASVSLLFGPTR